MSLRQTTLAETNFQPACEKCAALCCVYLAFDRSDHFAYDKPAGEPCRNLSTNNRCQIHSKLSENGFSGCVRFDCLGAGQRVTQELFGGADFRGNPNMEKRAIDAFHAMRRVQELLQLLQTAKILNLSPTQIKKNDALQQRLSPSSGWSFKSLTSFEQGSLPAEIAIFLSSLKEIATKRA